jgi:hypothetical protein
MKPGWGLAEWQSFFKENDTLAGKRKCHLGKYIDPSII